MEMSRTAMYLSLTLLAVACAAAYVCSRAVSRHFLARPIVEDWAGRSGYELLSWSWRTLRRGPFYWRTLGHTSLTQIYVFRVTARENTGTIRRGWICCYLRGSRAAFDTSFNPETDYAEVVWEEAAGV
jgi:hypothetical protein